MAINARFHLLIMIGLLAIVMIMGSLPIYGDNDPPPGTEKKTYTFPQPQNSGVPTPVVVPPGKNLPGTGLQSPSQKGSVTLPGAIPKKSTSSYSFPQPGGGSQPSRQNSTSSQASPQVRVMAPYTFPRVNIPSDLNNNSTQQDPYTVRMQYYSPPANTMPYNNNSSTIYPAQQNNVANPYNNSYWNAYRRQNSVTPYTYYNNNPLYQNMINLYNNLYNNGGRPAQNFTAPYNNGYFYQFFTNTNNNGYPGQNYMNPYFNNYPYQNQTYPYNNIYPYQNNTNTNNGNYYWRGK